MPAGFGQEKTNMPPFAWRNIYMYVSLHLVTCMFELCVSLCLIASRLQPQAFPVPTAFIWIHATVTFDPGFFLSLHPLFLQSLLTLTCLWYLFSCIRGFPCVAQLQCHQILGLVLNRRSRMWTCIVVLPVSSLRGDVTDNRPQLRSKRTSVVQVPFQGHDAVCPL